MKVKAQTNEMVVVDLESFEMHEIDVDRFMVFTDLMLPTVVRVYKDRLEIDVDVVGKKKKTLKIFYHDAILLNRVLHRICEGAIHRPDGQNPHPNPFKGTKYEPLGGFGKSSPYKPLSEGDANAHSEKVQS